MKKLLLAALLSAAATAGAQDFPTKAINLIVPNPPGGMNISFVSPAPWTPINISAGVSEVQLLFISSSRLG